jgi:hypothetical protein
MSTETQELTAVLRDAVHRHVVAQPRLADEFAVTFGRGNVDVAAQWLRHQLSQHSAEVTEAVGPGSSPDVEVYAEVDEFEKTVMAEIADIPGVEGLSEEEIDAIILDVLAEDDDE